MKAEWSNDREELAAHVGRLPDGFIPLYVVSIVVSIDTDGDKRYNLRTVAPEDAYPQVTDVVAACEIGKLIAASDLGFRETDDD